MMNNRPDPPPPGEAPFATAVVGLFQAVHPLDRVPRAGYLLRGVSEPESVAAHSYFLGLLALVYLEHYPQGLDPARVLALTLVHDCAEAQTMDLPMPTTDAYFAEAKRHMEQAVADQLFAGAAPRLAQLHAEFAAGETPEARLVRALDKAQMMLRVLNYEREHRGDLAEFWENPKNFRDFGIEPVAQLFDAICARAGKPRPHA